MTLTEPLLSESSENQQRNGKHHRDGFHRSINRPIARPRGYSYALRIIIGLTSLVILYITAKFLSVASLLSYDSSNSGPTNFDQWTFKGKTRHPLPPRVEMVINSERLRIHSEMRGYPFQGGSKIQNLLLEDGGQPVRAMVRLTG